MSRARTIANFGDGLVTADLPSDLGIVGGDLPAGSVLQVVHTNTKTIAEITTTSGFTDLGSSYNLSITPSSTSSKVLVMFDLQYRLIEATGSDNRGFGFQISRDSTAIYTAGADFELYNGSVTSSAADFRGKASWIILDSPSTTSAITYKPQCKSRSSDGVQFGANLFNSSVTLMEIAG